MLNQALQRCMFNVTMAALLVSLATIPFSACHGQVVFDSINLDGTFSGSQGGVAEIGSEVTLAGIARDLFQVDFVVGAVSSPRNVQVSVYANDGIAGAPGTLLAASPFQPAPMTGSPNPLPNSISDAFILSFPFNSITLPDTVTVTLNDDIPPGTPGTGSIAAPALTGTHVIGWSRFDGQPWVSSDFFDAPLSFRVLAVPEPSGGLIVVTLMMVAGLRRNRSI